MSRVKKYEDAAARIRAHRQRHSLVTLTVDLPSDVVQGLDDYLKFKDITKASVIERLIRNQLLRKR
jgi:hypothetical protein